MLVISRRVGERVQIGDDICVAVARIVGGGVRLAIEAPASVPIARGELQEGLPSATGQDGPPSQEHAPAEQN
jgi:carbon storage regulator CsrA